MRLWRKQAGIISQAYPVDNSDYAVGASRGNVIPWRPHGKSTMLTPRRVAPVDPP